MEDDVHSVLERIRRMTEGLPQIRPIHRVVVSAHVPLFRVRGDVQSLALCWTMPDPDDLHLEFLTPPPRDPADVETRTLRGLTIRATIPSPRRWIAVMHPVVWGILVSACWWGWFRGADPDRALLWELAMENLLPPTDLTVNPLRLQLAMGRLGSDEYGRTYARAYTLLQDVLP